MTTSAARPLTVTPAAGTARCDPGLRSVPEVRAGWLAAALLLLCALTRTVPLETVLPAYAAVVVLAGTVLPLRLGLLVAATAWGLVTGFVVHTGGRLTFTHADLVRLALLGSAAVVSWVVGRAVGSRVE